MIKSFLIESINDVESTNENVQSIDDNVQSISENAQLFDHQNNLSAESFEIISSFAITRFVRARRLSLRYQNLTDIIVLFQNDDFSNQFDDSSSQFSNQLDNSSSQISVLIFENSRRKEINDLLKRRVFELIIIEKVSRDVRIFNFRFVDEIKHSSTSDAYEKFRLVMQTYNDQDKTLILTQSSIIQRMSQRIILALTACTYDCHLYLRNITQAYVQSKISLNREFFIRSLFELNLSKRSILKIIKSLYEMLETETH